MRPKPRARATSSRPPPSPKPKPHLQVLFPEKGKATKSFEFCRNRARQKRLSFVILVDPPLWPRTLPLAAAAAAPPHVPVGVARRARTPSAPCLATESRGRGEISGPERILIVVFGPENRVENAFQGAEGKIIHLPEIENENGNPTFRFRSGRKLCRFGSGSSCHQLS